MSGTPGDSAAGLALEQGKLAQDSLSEPHSTLPPEKTLELLELIHQGDEARRKLTEVGTGVRASVTMYARSQSGTKNCELML